METLTVIREWESTYNNITHLNNDKGFRVATITGYKNQPKKSQKTIIVRGKEYKLKFS